MSPRTSEYEVFRRRLRDARVKAGLTQVEAAKRLGKSQSFISKAEAGERRIDVVELKAIARVYGVSVMYFLG